MTEEKQTRKQYDQVITFSAGLENHLRKYAS